MDEKKPPRISNPTAILMVGMALFFDLLSIVPLLSWVAAFTFWFYIFIWFAIIGLPILNTKRLITSLISFIVELFPVLSIIPTLTIGIILMVIFTRLEDAGINVPVGKLQGELKGGVSAGKSPATPSPKSGPAPTPKSPEAPAQQPSQPSKPTVGNEMNK